MEALINAWIVYQDRHPSRLPWVARVDDNFFNALRLMTSAEKNDFVTMLKFFFERKYTHSKATIQILKIVEEKLFSISSHTVVGGRSISTTQEILKTIRILKKLFQHGILTEDNMRSIHDGKHLDPENYLKELDYLRSHEMLDQGVFEFLTKSCIYSVRSCVLALKNMRRKGLWLKRDLLIKRMELSHESHPLEFKINLIKSLNALYQGEILTHQTLSMITRDSIQSPHHIVSMLLKIKSVDLLNLENFSSIEHLLDIETFSKLILYIPNDSLTLSSLSKLLVHSNISECYNGLYAWYRHRPNLIAPNNLDTLFSHNKPLKLATLFIDLDRYDLLSINNIRKILNCNYFENLVKVSYELMLRQMVTQENLDHLLNNPYVLRGEVLTQDRFNNLVHLSQSGDAQSLEFKSFIAEIFKLKAQELGGAQNTHTASINKSSLESIEKLKGKYSEQIKPDQLNAVIENIKSWINELPANPLSKAAKGFISDLMDSNKEEYRRAIAGSGISVKELVGLAYTAIEDETERFGSLEDAKMVFLEGLWEIRRGPFLNQAGIDMRPNAGDIPICMPGCINKLIEKLKGVNKLVKMNFVSLESLSLKYQSFTKNTILEYLSNKKNTLNPTEFSKFLAKLSKHIDQLSNIFLKEMQAKLLEELFDEFRDLFPNGKETQIFINMAEEWPGYIDFKKILEEFVQSYSREDVCVAGPSSGLRVKRSITNCHEFIDEELEKLEELGEFELRNKFSIADEGLALLETLYGDRHQDVAKVLDRMLEVKAKPGMNLKAISRVKTAEVHIDQWVLDLDKKLGEPLIKTSRIDDLKHTLFESGSSAEKLWILKVNDHRVALLHSEGSWQWKDAFLFNKPQKYTHNSRLVQDMAKLYSPKIEGHISYSLYKAPELMNMDAIDSIFLDWSDLSPSRIVESIFPVKNHKIIFHDKKLFEEFDNLRTEDFLAIQEFLGKEPEITFKNMSVSEENLLNYHHYQKNILEILKKGVKQDRKIEHIKYELYNLEIQRYVNGLPIPLYDKIKLVEHLRLAAKHLSINSHHIRSAIWWMRATGDLSHGDYSSLLALIGLEGAQRVALPALLTKLRPFLAAHLSEEITETLLSKLALAPGAIIGAVGVGISLDKLFNAKNDFERKQGAIHLMQNVTFIAASFAGGPIGVMLDGSFMVGFAYIDGELIFEAEEKCYRIILEHDALDSIKYGFGSSILKYEKIIQESILEHTLTNLLILKYRQLKQSHVSSNPIVDIVITAYPTVKDIKHQTISRSRYHRLRRRYPNFLVSNLIRTGVPLVVYSALPRIKYSYMKKYDELTAAHISLDSHISNFRAKQVKALDHFAPWVDDEDLIYVVFPHGDNHCNGQSPGTVHKNIFFPPGANIESCSNFTSTLSEDEIRINYQCEGRYFLNLFESRGDILGLTGARTDPSRKNNIRGLLFYEKFLQCQPVPFNFHVLLISHFVQSANFYANANNEENLLIDLLPKPKFFPPVFYKMFNPSVLNLKISGYQSVSFKFMQIRQSIQIQKLEVKKIIFDFRGLPAIRRRSDISFHQDKITFASFSMNIPQMEKINAVIIYGSAKYTHRLGHLPKSHMLLHLPSRVSTLHKIDVNMKGGGEPLIIYLEGPGTEIRDSQHFLIKYTGQGMPLIASIERDNQKAARIDLNYNGLINDCQASFSETSEFPIMHHLKCKVSNLYIGFSKPLTVLFSSYYFDRSKNLSSTLIFPSNGGKPILKLDVEIASQSELRKIAQSVPDPIKDMVSMVSVRNNATEKHDHVFHHATFQEPIAHNYSLSAHTTSRALRFLLQNNTLPIIPNPVASGVLEISMNEEATNLRHIPIAYNCIHLIVPRPQKYVVLKVWEINDVLRPEGSYDLLLFLSYPHRGFSLNQALWVTLEDYFKKAEGVGRRYLSINDKMYRVNFSSSREISIVAELMPTLSQTYLYRRNFIHATRFISFLDEKFAEKAVLKDVIEIGNYSIVTSSFSKDMGIVFSDNPKKIVTIQALQNIYLYRLLNFKINYMSFENISSDMNISSYDHVSSHTNVSSTNLAFQDDRNNETFSNHSDNPEKIVTIQALQNFHLYSLLTFKIQDISFENISFDRNISSYDHVSSRMNVSTTSLALQNDTDNETLSNHSDVRSHRVKRELMEYQPVNNAACHSVSIFQSLYHYVSQIGGWWKHANEVSSAAPPMQVTRIAPAFSKPYAAENQANAMADKIAGKLADTLTSPAVAYVCQDFFKSTQAGINLAKGEEKERYPLYYAHKKNSQGYQPKQIRHFRKLAGKEYNLFEDATCKALCSIEELDTSNDDYDVYTGIFSIYRDPHLNNQQKSAMEYNFLENR